MVTKVYNFSMTRGDSQWIGLSLRNTDKKPDEVWFTCRRKKESAYPVFAMSLDSGIEPVETEEGNRYDYSIRIAPEATQKLPQGGYWYDIELKYGNDIYTPVIGNLGIIGDVTRRPFAQHGSGSVSGGEVTFHSTSFIVQGETSNIFDIIIDFAEETIDTQELNYLAIRGEKGDTGERGPQGERGEQGERGLQGIEGQQGERGEKGDKGDAGNGISSAVLNDDFTLTINFTDGTRYTTASIRGEKGAKGDTGEKGSAGPRGERGEKGDTGDRGLKGETGDTGRGILSTVLNTDSTLTITFTDGTSFTTPSIKGERGAQGKQGVKGNTGDTGQTGPKGDTGNGISNAMLNADYTLTLFFTDGTSYKTPVIRGEQGVTGQKGEKGDKGDPGKNGID